ncbi:ORF6N domain-containing protein [Sphingobacterium faecale]|uniref:ORF6N domain-containing protein n=1 Tax=Sphingobacterium faecale TaxID=2803775 RepID=UPI00293D4FFF|nr:ORF6N domain-containing protein [Sphingobacterium faecale]
MLDRDLAEIYGVETRTLKQAVRRNIDRFPPDFRFQLTNDEKNELVTNCDRFDTLKHSSVNPQAFNEHGVLMLANVLKSSIATQMSIRLVRTFVQLRKNLSLNTQIQLEIAEIKNNVEQIAKKQKGHDQNIDLLFEYIDRLQEKQDTPQQPRQELGFKIGKK